MRCGQLEMSPAKLVCLSLVSSRQTSKSTEQRNTNKKIFPTFTVWCDVRFVHHDVVVWETEGGTIAFTAHASLSKKQVVSNSPNIAWFCPGKKPPAYVCYFTIISRHQLEYFLCPPSLSMVHLRLVLDGWLSRWATTLRRPILWASVANVCLELFITCLSHVELLESHFSAHSSFRFLSIVVLNQLTLAA